MTILNPGTQSQSQTGSAGAKIFGAGVGDGPGPAVMAAATLGGNKVVNRALDILLPVNTALVQMAM
ncbi:hypothetical protein [Paraburkholderia hospita]|uniref:hypothetical protein n=1 Tax=Paraburkholderia hospita TaxID=169430 RepID=UPI003BF9AB46